MSIKYDRETDILLVEMSSNTIDHAEETDNIIVHFDQNQKPVLLEIMEASKFLGDALQTTAESFKQAA